MQLIISMSKFLKISPAGIDKLIQSLQEYLYSKLLAKWGLVDADYNCHGRAYRNQTTDGYVPESFNASGDYSELFFDDSLKALSFSKIAVRLTQ